MASPFSETIDQVIALFQGTFEHAVIKRREEGPALAILEMRGDYGAYRVHLQEIWRPDGLRKYAYYVLSFSKLVTGFDNVADPRALRLRYSLEAGQHRFESVPHRHTEGKQAIELTEEMDCARFIAWLRANLAVVRETEPGWTATPQVEVNAAAFGKYVME